MLGLTKWEAQFIAAAIKLAWVRTETSAEDKKKLDRLWGKIVDSI